MRKVSRTFRLDPELIERFDKAAMHANVDKTKIVEDAIEKFVIEQEALMNQKMYAILDLTHHKMSSPPVMIRDEFASEYEIIEGTEDEILEEAKKRNAKYIHYFESEEDDFGGTDYRYVSTKNNPFYKCEEFEGITPFW